MMAEYVEEFLRIDWTKGDVAVSDYIKQKVKSDLDTAGSKSFDFHLFFKPLNEICIYVEDEEGTMKTRKMKKIYKYVPGYNPAVRLQMTCLSKPEMRKLFSYIVRRKKNEVVSLSESEQMQYNMYMHTASKEQEQFAKLAALHWSRSNHNRIFCIRQSIFLYMDELWMTKIDAIKQHYPVAYRPISPVSLTCDKQKADNQIFMTHLGALQIQDYIDMIELPMPWKHVSVPVLYETLKSGKNPLFSSMVKPVGCDKTALEFAQELKADVVISTSALKTLANNLPPYYTNEWNIIVTVKEVQCGNRKKKIVFVDKPLPPSTLTNVEYRDWHAKLACKMLLTGVKEKVKSRFGKGYVKKEHVKVYKNKNKNYESSSDSCANEVLTRNFEWKMNLWKKENDDWTSESNTETYRCSSGSECSLSSVQSKRKRTSTLENVCSHQRDELENPTPSSVGGEVTNHDRQPSYSYRLWKLHSDCDNNKIQLKQKRHIKCDDIKIKPLTIITRNKIDGFILEGESPTHALISSKVEYQPELGAEIMFRKELIKEWIDLLCTPHSWLVRVRISHKGEYIMLEQKKIGDVEAEALRLHQFDLKNTLNTIQILLCQLCNLKKPGEYLVMHSSNESGFARVYTSVPTTTQNVFNLHDFYEKQWPERLSKELRAPWRPIDKTIFTPLHYLFQYVPGTYKPKYPSPWVVKYYDHLSKVKHNVKKTVQNRTQKKVPLKKQNQVKPGKKE